MPPYPESLFNYQMEEKDIIVNHVANSPLVVFDLEEHYPIGYRVAFDIKKWLFEGMILKENDLREYVKSHDWRQYRGKNVALHCSVDAIIPTWAYMLITTKLSPYANMIIMGSIAELETTLFRKMLSQLDLELFRDKKMVIKGCGNREIPEPAYIEITRLLTPIASSIMYGEPCSTVPLYKRPKDKND